MSSRETPPEQAPIRLRVDAPDASSAERLLAEAFAVGARGVEEEAGPDRVRLVIYGTRDRQAGLCDVIESFRNEGVSLVDAAAVDVTDWSEAWKEGLEAIVISNRLVVRPSFVSFDASPDQHELIVDPGQAFGTGGHASTRLVLEWIDRLAADEGLSGRSILDVGTGSGVLALAGLALGSPFAAGFDLDGVAVREAAVVARQNGLDAGLALYTGGIEAVAGARFDVVLVNLLRSEMLPIAESIRRSLSDGATLILSGLLERDGPIVLDRFEALGLERVGERSLVDDSGDRWISPRLRSPAGSR